MKERIAQLIDEKQQARECKSLKHATEPPITDSINCNVKRKVMHITFLEQSEYSSPSSVDISPHSSATGLTSIGSEDLMQCVSLPEFVDTFEDCSVFTNDDEKVTPSVHVQEQCQELEADCSIHRLHKESNSATFTDLRGKPTFLFNVERLTEEEKKQCDMTVTNLADNCSDTGDDNQTRSYYCLASKQNHDTIKHGNSFNI